MKKKNLVVLLISIIFPIVVAVFIGMYSYGTFDNWSKNKDKFIDTMFNEELETSVSVENYVKFASSHYLNNSVNMTVYSDYQERTVLEAQNGTYTIDNKVTMAPYALAETGGDLPYISYMFFLYNINYNNVTPSNVYFISVKGTADEDYDHLLAAIEQFDKDWTEDATTGSATTIASRQSPFPIYDIHAVLEEDNDSDKVPYAYSLTPNRNYQVIDNDGYEDNSITFEKMSNCSFAIIETTNENKTTVLMSGLIENIKRTPEALSKLDNINHGYGSTTVDYMDSLENAGYFAYMVPTLAWQCAIALLISGVVSFLFYMTWTYEEDDPKKKFKKNKK